MEKKRKEEKNVSYGGGSEGWKRKGWGPVISLPELLATLPLNSTHRWKTCSFILSSRHTPRHTLDHTPAFSHVQTDTHALTPSTYTHMQRPPPPEPTRHFNDFYCSEHCFSLHMTSIWGARAGCENYCTSAPIYMTLYKPRVGPAKVSGPTYNTW